MDEASGDMMLKEYASTSIQCINYTTIPMPQMPMRKVLAAQGKAAKNNVVSLLLTAFASVLCICRHWHRYCGICKHLHAVAVTDRVTGSVTVTASNPSHASKHITWMK